MSSYIELGITGVVSALSGSGFTAWLTQKGKNAGDLALSNATELSKVREEMRAQLREQKIEHREDLQRSDQKWDALYRDSQSKHSRELAELRQDFKNTKQELEEVKKSFFTLESEFHAYRVQTRLVFRMAREGNPAWQEIARLLEEEESPLQTAASILYSPLPGVGKEEPPPPTEQAVRAPRILVVDDYPDTLDLLQKTLCMAGYGVTTAASGLEGLKRRDESILNGDPFDLIVLDYSMPDMNGETVARLVRGEGDEKTRIVFFTGHKKDMLPGAAEMTGATILEKPLAPDKIVAAVQKALSE